jgi:hypothetical protein
VKTQDVHPRHLRRRGGIHEGQESSREEGEGEDEFDFDLEAKCVKIPLSREPGTKAEETGAVFAEATAKPRS